MTTALIMPNSGLIFDKPLAKLLKQLDKRQAERELRRVIYYMKQRGLLKYEARDYKHGLILTKKGKQRLKRSNFSALTIPRPKSWDKMWRLVFFDIPEKEKQKRNALNLKLKQLGFQQLQISIWVHPYPCRAEIEAVCENIGIRRYVTYVEVAHIDSANKLHKRFDHLFKA